MTEFYIEANSFAAPFVSDRSEHYVDGDDPLSALQDFVDEYSHPCGLYSANLYASADACKKGEKPLAEYRSLKDIAISEAVSAKGAASVDTQMDGTVLIDGKKLDLPDPKSGRIL